MDRLSLSFRQTLTVVAAFSVWCPVLAAADVSALVAQGDRFDEQLLTSSALEAYLAADRQSPGDARVLQKIAREYGLSMNDTTDADEQRTRAQHCLDFAKRAVNADARNAGAQLAVAICYGRLASHMDHKTALEYSRQVKEHVDLSLQLDSQNDYAHHVLGAWNYELASIGSLQRAIARIIYGAVPAASYADAEKAFRQAIALSPDRVSHHVELGRTLAALGRREQAIAELKHGVALPSREKDDFESKRRATAALKQLHVET